MKNLRPVILGVVIIAVIGGIVGYYMYNKPHQNVAEAKPEKAWTADDFYAAVKGKDSITVSGFNNKVYEVDGTISSIVSPNDSTINIFLGISGNSTDNVSCAMDPKYLTRLKNLKAGDKLKVKGIFTGLNKFEDKDLGISTMDIILSRAVAIRE